PAHPLPDEGGGPRHGGDTLGGHPPRDAPGGIDGHLRRPGPRLRPRARRDDGAGHADRQLEPDQPLAVLPGQHPRRAPRPQIPRGRAARGRGPHVRRAGPAGHHAGGERDRRGDHGVLHPAPGQGVISHEALAAAPVRLERSPLERRALKSLILTGLVWAAAIAASIPLVSVLYMLAVRGGSRLAWSVLVELPPAGFEMGGGFGNALVGTVVMTGLGGLVSIPLGVFAAVYLAELGPESRLARAARFATKTLTGMPSILAGVFAYAVVVLVTGTYSAPAGGLALAVLMLP